MSPDEKSQALRSGKTEDRGLRVEGNEIPAKGGEEMEARGSDAKADAMPVSVRGGRLAEAKSAPESRRGGERLRERNEILLERGESCSDERETTRGPGETRGRCLGRGGLEDFTPDCVTGPR